MIYGYECKAWVPPWQTLEEVIKATNPEELLAISTADLASQGYSVIAEAKIRLEFYPQQKAVEEKIAALRSQRTRIIATAEAAATEIEGKIQNLLSLTHEWTK